MSVTISGLDKLQRELKDAQRAMESLKDTIAHVKFTRGDPASVQAAIRDMEATIDSKMSIYRNNPFVAPFIKAAKEEFRTKLLELGKAEA